MFLAKKSLGQHFLTDESYLRMIVDALYLKPTNTKKSRAIKSPDLLMARTFPMCVEIGPGKGSLTAELLSRGHNVIALEKDRRLVPVLQEKFAQEIASRQLHIIEIDALDFSPDAWRLMPGAYSVIGNIPYYITGALLQKFLTGETPPSTVVFLVQKEVAERIARAKKESILSLSVKAYGTPVYVKTIPAGAFSPPPKVDSAILAITGISRKNFTNADHEKRFFELIHAGFAHKRKLLVRNLELIFDKNAPAALTAAHIPEKARAEDVSLEQWLVLAKEKIV